MSTKMSEIHLTSEIDDKELPVLVEAIAERFFGIETIHYYDNGLVAIGTKNSGTISIDKLSIIQKELGANTMSISMAQTQSSGLMYVLNYSSK
jgi:hypothetical protein